MDLRRQYPRSPRALLAGYVHLPRMLDKCRATLAGTLGEYIYPCPLDQLLLDFAGIGAEQFTEAVKRLQTDEAVAEWFRRSATTRDAGDPSRFNEELLARRPDTPEKLAYFTKTRDAIDPSRTDIVSWSDLLDLEEGRSVPRRT